MIPQVVKFGLITLTAANDRTHLNCSSVVGRSTIINVGSIRSAGTVSFGNSISDRLGAVYI